MRAERAERSETPAGGAEPGHASACTASTALRENIAAPCGYHKVGNPGGLNGMRQRARRSGNSAGHAPGDHCFGHQCFRRSMRSYENGPDFRRFWSAAAGDDQRPLRATRHSRSPLGNASATRIPGSSGSTDFEGRWRQECRTEDRRRKLDKDRARQVSICVSICSNDPGSTQRPPTKGAARQIRGAWVIRR